MDSAEFCFTPNACQDLAWIISVHHVRRHESLPSTAKMYKQWEGKGLPEKRNALRSGLHLCQPSACTVTAGKLLLITMSF